MLLMVLLIPLLSPAHQPLVSHCIQEENRRRSKLMSCAARCWHARWCGHQCLGPVRRQAVCPAGVVCTCATQCPSARLLATHPLPAPPSRVPTPPTKKTLPPLPRLRPAASDGSYAVAWTVPEIAVSASKNGILTGVGAIQLTIYNIGSLPLVLGKVSVHTNAGDLFAAQPLTCDSPDTTASPWVTVSYTKPIAPGKKVALTFKNVGLPTSHFSPRNALVMMKSGDCVPGTPMPDFTATYITYSV